MMSQLRSAPNLLTLLRLIFIPFVIIAVQQHLYLWALGIFVVAGITDGLDGLAGLIERVEQAEHDGPRGRDGHELQPQPDRSGGACWVSTRGERVHRPAFGAGM